MTGRDDALVYPVAGLLADVHGAFRDLAVGPATVDAGPEIVLARPIEGRLHLARTNRGLLVRADVSTILATTCSRCLRPIAVPLDLHIAEEVLPSRDLTTGAAVDATAEPEAVRLNDHHELDLEPLVRETIQLEEPLAPLCRPDCPGLCGVCGEDPTAPDHPVHEAPVDPRLEALRAFVVDERAETD